MELPTTTTERLLAVADVIEQAEAWDQGDWFTLTPTEIKDWAELYEENSSSSFVVFHQGRNDPECGTKCCVAGWAIRFTPKDVDLPGCPGEAGAVALGFSPYLAEAVFDGGLGGDLDHGVAAYHLAEVLRAFAGVEEADRTVATLLKWYRQDDENVTVLFELRRLEDEADYEAE